uniref:DUF724 domain-containing protein 7 isoform X2 n=1 Tax=Rhizophora mucronata TaxID=61149 RepID=A0A2P2NN79_RHIMU
MSGTRLLPVHYQPIRAPWLGSRKKRWRRRSVSGPLLGRLC